VLGGLPQDDLSSYIDYMLNVGEKLFNQKALPLAPMRLGAAQEYVRAATNRSKPDA
jgi:hypothetical protein